MCPNARGAGEDNRSLDLHGRVPLSASLETRLCDHNCNACRRTRVALVYQLRSIGCSLHGALEIHNDVLLVRRMRDSNHQAVQYWAEGTEGLRNRRFKPVLNWANVCSPNILRTVQRTMIRFLTELLVRRTMFGQFDELRFVLNWLLMRCKLRPELAADAQQTA